MELIHTIGIALDPSAAKSGSAEAASAFAQVGQAAEAMSNTARLAASALGPVGVALGSVATALAAIDLHGFASGLSEAMTPLERLQRQLASVSANAADLRGNLAALDDSASRGKFDGKLLAAPAPTDRAQPSLLNDSFGGMTNLGSQKSDDLKAAFASAAFAPVPKANTPLFSIPVPARKVEDLSFPSASSMAPAQLTAPSGLNFAALPQDIAATSAPFDTLKRKVDSTSDAAMRLRTNFAELPTFNNEFRKPDDPLSLNAIKSEAELRKSMSQLKPLSAPPPTFSGIPLPPPSLLETPLTLLPPKQPSYAQYFPPASPNVSFPKPSSEEKKPSPPRSSFYQFQEGMLQSASSYGDLGKQSRAAGEDTTGVLKSAFSTFFTDALLQRAKAPKPRDAFHTMMKTIRNAMEDVVIKRFVTEPVTGLVTGWFGNLLKGPSPASAPGLLGGVGGLVSNVLKFLTLSGHTGGVVGSSFGTMTLRDPALFLGAPRLHHGLAPDEFPAILQRGERVVPKSQVGAWDRGGGGININVNVDGSRGGTPAQNKAFGAEVARQIEAMVDARIARAAMPRGILRPAASYA